MFLNKRVPVLFLHHGFLVCVASVSSHIVNAADVRRGYGFVEIRDSQTAYVVPGHHGLAVWQDGRVVCTLESFPMCFCV